MNIELDELVKDEDFCKDVLKQVKVTRKELKKKFDMAAKDYVKNLDAVALRKLVSKKLFC